MITNSEELLRRPCDIATLAEAREISEKLRFHLKKQNKRAKSQDLFGIGLAAPQIGIQKQVAIVEIPWRKISVVLVNPLFTGLSEEIWDVKEGCLSFPNELFDTKRYSWVEVHCTGWEEPQVFHELAGIVVQHEMAHLAGLLPHDFATELHPENWESEARRIREEYLNQKQQCTHAATAAG